MHLPLLRGACVAVALALAAVSPALAADGVRQLVEALTTLSDPPGEHRPALYDEAEPGWRYPGESKRLLSPFAALSTDQAREAIPLLIDLLARTGSLYNGPMGESSSPAFRANQALTVIAFRSYGGFETGGELKPRESYERQGRLEDEIRAAWPKWWEANRDRGLEEWRADSMREMLASLNADPVEAAGVSEPLERLERLAPYLGSFLTDDLRRAVIRIAELPTADTELRVASLRTLEALDPAEALRVESERLRDPKDSDDLRASLCIPIMTHGIDAAAPLLDYARELAARLREDDPTDRTQEATRSSFGYACYALRKISGQESQPLLIETPEQRQATLEELEGWYERHRK